MNANETILEKDRFVFYFYALDRALESGQLRPGGTEALAAV